MRPGMYEGPGENYEPVKTSDLAVGDVVIVERKKWDYDTGRPVPSDFFRAIVGERATVSGPQKYLTNEPSAEWPAFAPWLWKLYAYNDSNHQMWREKR